MGASYLQHIYHTLNMGKLLDILPNSFMLCYYFKRVLCQLLGYAVPFSKEYKYLYPIVFHLSFNMLDFPFFDICKNESKLQIKAPNPFRKICSCFGQFNYFFIL